jgi:hypothetical protein
VNKVLAILMATLLSTAALAESNGINVEFERERGTQSPNTMTNTVKVAPYVKFDNGIKADIQVGASRDDGQVSGNNNPITNTAEARVQKLVEVYPGLHLGGRLGVGEVFNGVNAAGKTVDFSYYTAEPKAEYFLTKDLSLLASWRYRDSFSDNNNYLTRTWKVGFGYDVTKKDLVEVKYFKERGDIKSNGVVLEYTRGF